MRNFYVYLAAVALDVACVVACYYLAMYLVGYFHPAVAGMVYYLTGVFRLRVTVRHK